jgi:hypothetical protein
MSAPISKKEQKKMRLTKLLPAASAASFVMATIITLPTSAAPSTTTIKLGGEVPMLDSGIAISYVGVPVSIRCPAGSGPTQFNFSVTQPPDVTGSFGFVTAQCTGHDETFVVAVQSNFGSLYHEGKAVASANCFFPCVATASRNVTMFRLADDF